MVLEDLVWLHNEGMKDLGGLEGTGSRETLEAFAPMKEIGKEGWRLGGGGEVALEMKGRNSGTRYCRIGHLRETNSN